MAHGSLLHARVGARLRVRVVRRPHERETVRLELCGDVLGRGRPALETAGPILAAALPDEHDRRRIELIIGAGPRHRIVVVALGVFVGAQLLHEGAVPAEREIVYDQCVILVVVVVQSVPLVARKLAVSHGRRRGGRFCGRRVHEAAGGGGPFKVELTDRVLSEEDGERKWVLMANAYMRTGIYHIVSTKRTVPCESHRGHGAIVLCRRSK